MSNKLRYRDNSLSFAFSSNIKEAQHALNSIFIHNDHTKSRLRLASRAREWMQKALKNLDEWEQLEREDEEQI